MKKQILLIVAFLTLFQFMQAIKNQQSIIQNLLFSRQKNKQFFKSPSQLNNKPVIGILTQPSFLTNYSYSQYSEINSDNVVWLQASGAQVIPVDYGLSQEELKEIFYSINGLFFAGADFNYYNKTYITLDNDLYYSKYQESATYLIQLAMEAFEQDDFFPIFGTCSGFELIIDIISNPPSGNSLTYLDDNNRSENITLVNFQDSYIFQGMTDSMIDYIQLGASSFFFHNYGISTEKFLNTTNLTDFFHFTSVAYNLNETQFISSIEGKKYLIFGIQFHPEKSMVDYSSHYNANHSPEAIEIDQFIGNKFINLARQNYHQYNLSNIELNSLILKQTQPVSIGSYADYYIFQSINNTILVS